MSGPCSRVDHMPSENPFDDRLRVRATEILRELTGHPEASFRDGQFDAIAALVNDDKRVLVVQRLSLIHI